MASNIAVIDVDAIDDAAPTTAPSHRRRRHRRARSHTLNDVDKPVDVETFDEEAALTATLVEKALVDPFAARDIVRKLLEELGGETVDKNEEQDDDEDDGDYEDDGIDDGGSVSGDSSDDSSSDEEDEDEDDGSSEAVDQAENEDATSSGEKSEEVRVRDPLMERVHLLKAAGAPLDDEPSHIRLWCTKGPNALEPPLESEYLVDLDGKVVHITEFSLDELKEVRKRWVRRKSKRIVHLAGARTAAQDRQRRVRYNRDKEALTDLELYDHAPALRFAVHSIRHDISEGRTHFDDVTPDVVRARVAEYYSFPEFCTVEQALVYHAEKYKDEVMALPADPAATTGKRKRSPTGDASSSTQAAIVLSSATGVVGQPSRPALKRALPEDTTQPSRKTVRYASALAVEQDTGLIWPVVEDITKTFSRRDRGQYAALIKRMPRHLFGFVTHRLKSHLKHDGVDYRAPKRQRTEADPDANAEPPASLLQRGLGLFAAAMALL